MEGIQRAVKPNLTDMEIVCEHNFPVEGPFVCELCFLTKFVVKGKTYEEEKRIWDAFPRWPRLWIVPQNRK